MYDFGIVTIPFCAAMSSRDCNIRRTKCESRDEQDRKRLKKTMAIKTVKYRGKSVLLGFLLSSTDSHRLSIAISYSFRFTSKKV